MAWKANKNAKTYDKKGAGAAQKYFQKKDRSDRICHPWVIHLFAMVGVSAPVVWFGD
jgi:hypothetical protein